MKENINLRETVEYKECGFQLVKCPVCGNETLDSYFICPCCNWEYDGKTQEDDYSSANGMTVKEYRAIHCS